MELVNPVIPHAGKKLAKTTVSKGRTNDNAWRGEASGTKVDERQQESRQGETAETERSWVGELALLVDLVETWLELTTKGSETRRVAGVDVGERVASIVVTASKQTRSANGSSTINAH